MYRKCHMLNFCLVLDKCVGIIFHIKLLINSIQTHFLTNTFCFIEEEDMKKNVITISREFGSGGRTVGRQVAERLGIAYYDKDIIRQVAQESGLAERYVEEYGEFSPSADRFAYQFVDLMEDGSSPLIKLWNVRESVIRDLAGKGPCVIVGVGADYILRDRHDCLKVFLFADEETKQKRISELYEDPGLKVRNRIHNMDTRRSINYHFFTGQEWGKAQNYDIALNSGSLGTETCVDIIVRSVED